MKLKDTKIGHNNPPKELDDLINKDARVEINPTVMKLLKPTLDEAGEKYIERIINDTKVLGFKAKANPGGTRSYFFQYRPKGIDEEKTKEVRDKNPKARAIYLNPVKVHIGNYFEKRENRGVGTTPAIARKLAIEVRDAIKVGKDPFTIIANRRKAKTLGVIYNEFVKNRLMSAAYKPKTKRDMKSRKKIWVELNSNGFKQKQVRRTQPTPLSIANRKMVDLEKDDYVAYHNAVSLAGKYQANRCIEDLRLVEKYALEKGYIKKTVCHFKKRELNKEIKRMEVEDPYTVDELKRLRRALLKLAKMDPRSFSSCYGILADAFLGGRGKSEIFSLMWDQINMPKKEIRHYDTKNNEPMTRQFDVIGAAIFRIMLRVRFATNPRDPKYKYVFPTSKKKSKVKHITDPRKIFKKACKMANVKVKPLHMLRHTWATIAAEATEDIEAVRVMGGWKSINSLMIYLKFLKRRERAAIKKVDKFMRSHAN